MRVRFGSMQSVVSIFSIWVMTTSGTQVSAQTASWINSAGGNWDVPANWSGTPPVAGGSLTQVLNFGPSATYSATNNFVGPFAINQLNFNHSSGTATLASFGGSSLNFTGTNPSIVMAGSGNARIGSPITLTGATMISGAGTAALSISGFISTPSPSPGLLSSLTVNSSAPVELSGGGTFNNDGTSSGLAGFIQVLGGSLRLNGGVYTVNYVGVANDRASLSIDNGTPANPTQFHATGQASFTGNAVYFGRLANSNVIATIDGAGTSVTGQETMVVASRAGSLGWWKRKKK